MEGKRRRRGRGVGRRAGASLALAALVLAVTAAVALAADGDLDTSFNGTGMQTTDFGGLDFGEDVAIQDDGKIVAVGSFNTVDFALARYNTDGTLDTSFDGDSGTGNGKVTTDFGSSDLAFDVAIQDDGKIVVVGRTGGADWAIARYNTNGQLDDATDPTPGTTFDGDGKLTIDFGGFDEANGVAIQDDGKIVVVGNFIGTADFGLVRLNTDGTFDASFDGDGAPGNGKFTTDFGGNDRAFDVAIQADGKIVAMGGSSVAGNFDFALARYNPSDGTLDTTFDGDSLTGNGKVITSFGGGTDFALGVAIQADGRIVAAGIVDQSGANDFGLARYNPADGKLDIAFDGDGKVTTNVGPGGNGGASDVAIQDDGKIVAAGGDGNDFALARYSGTDGSIDTTFGGAPDDPGERTTNFGFGGELIGGVELQDDGKIVATGSGQGGDFLLARYTNRDVPAITTQASGSVAAGGSVSDTATLSQGTSPSGTITFTLYGPNDGTCAGPAFDSDTQPVSGNGNYTSAPIPVDQAGTFRWIAEYSGDANNNDVSTQCNDANESVVVTKAQPSISTVSSPNVTVGGQVSDTATVSNTSGANSGGIITFRLFGPSDANCAGPPAFTDTENVSGNGNYTSDSTTPLPAGTYRWTAEYSGDDNNNGVISACNSAGESVTVTQANPSFTTSSTPVNIKNGAILDTATLSGGFNPTGTITFQLFAPGDTNCTGTPVGGSQEAVNGNGSYTSDPVFVTETGTYRWTATYSGDINNQSKASPCNVEFSEVFEDTEAIVGQPDEDGTGDQVPGPPPNCRGRKPTIVGSPGHDDIRGTRKDDVIVGLGGHDDIIGLRGNDVICGNAGHDDIFGNRGDDRLAGGKGNDDLFGGPGDDRLFGGSGHNTLKAGPGG